MRKKKTRPSYVFFFYLVLLGFSHPHTVSPWARRRFITDDDDLENKAFESLNPQCVFPERDKRSKPLKSRCFLGFSFGTATPPESGGCTVSRKVP